MALRAVVFDVDFTLSQPGPDLGPAGYRGFGLRHGLDLDPARYDEARRLALDTLAGHPELDHDEEIWIAFTQRIMEGMGASGFTYGAALELTRAWEDEQQFEIYPDVLPTLAFLRERGLRIGLLSNTARDLEVFAAHHDLAADAVLTSRVHGKTKPHASIFARMLELLDVAAAETVMVGDTLEDDVHGARAVGMQALLLDRADRYPDVAGRLTDLGQLPHRLALI